MGLFDHLFKPKSDPAGEEQVEAAQTPETASRSDAAVNLPPPKPPVIAPPDAFGARSLGQIVTPGRAGTPAQRGGPQIKPSDEGNVAREIVLTLDDVLARIPKELLGEGAHDGRRVLRFSVADLSADIARGRAAVPLSQIAEQCPDIFHVPIDEDNDVLIRLPLQKLVEQIAPRGISATLARAGESPDAKIHLSIAAILRTCPREIIAREIPPVAETERITFPFAPIERQLPSGRVDVSSIRFVAALPLHMHEYFRAIEGVRVPLPLDEIFQNLPGLSATAPSPAPMPVGAPPPEPAPQLPPPSGVTFTPAPAHSPVSPPVSEAPPPVEPSPIPKLAPPVDPTRAPGFTPASGPAPAPRAVQLPQTEPQAASPVPPRPAPQVDLAKDEIAALRARIAALKVEFSVPSMSPVVPGRIKEEPSGEALPVLKSEAPAEISQPLESAAATDPIPVQPAPLVSPAPLPATFGPQANELPSPGLEPPAPDPTPESMAESAPVSLASDPPLDVPPAPGLDLPSLSPPESVFASPSLPAVASAPSPELFRPPLVPPPVAPVVITTPRIEPPGPVMLPTRIVAPLPVRPYVAPPRLFSAGENVPLPEVHPLAPAAEPEPPEPPPPPPPPPPPLSLDHAYGALGIEGEQALARVAEHVATLPGLSACVIDVRHEAAEAGVFPEGLDAAGIRTLVAPLAAALAGRAGEHISLFSEHGSISVFARGEARLTVLHRARVFLPGIREKLSVTTDALADA